MTRTLILAAALATVAGSAFANPFATHAFENSDFGVAEAIQNGGADVTTLGTGGSISGLEVALIDAIENDDRQKAAVLAARLNAATDGASFSTQGSSAALEVALKFAIENDDRQKANFLRAQLGR